MNKIVCGFLIFFVGATMALSTRFIKAGQNPTAQAPDTASLQEREHWPSEIRSGKLVFKVHQPQVESWDGSRIEAYSAIEVRPPQSGNPLYGVVFISAKTYVDKFERMVEFRDVQIHRAVFPAATDKTESWLQALRDSVIDRTLFFSLDRFEAALAVMETEPDIEAMALKSNPPLILFSSEPAVLIYIDGTPAFLPVKGTDLQRVINTRPLILKDAAGKHYMHLFDGWMEAGSLHGSWVVSPNPSAELETAKDAAVAGGQVDLLEGVVDPESEEKKPSLKNGPVPDIYVATEPAELIVSEGDPEYEAIEGTSLLIAKNTTGHLFRHSVENAFYILISGRWFRSNSQKGPWEHVSGGRLPADFAQISDSSPKENVKASVPGTPQAKEAVIANSIPQMATVDRKNTKLNPLKFDGKPKFESIEGTGLQYAVNTATPLIKTGPATFYAVENGVWFTARGIDGPWAVADSIPASIYTIPPSSPLHYVTYVKVYGFTADTVNVGYTPGYNGIYILGGSGRVAVFGTGYRYKPWIGSVWFEPPVTYGHGCSMNYAPWSGWAFNFGFNWYLRHEMASMGWGHYYSYPPFPLMYGWSVWGPRGAAAWGGLGLDTAAGNTYHRWGTSSGVTRMTRGVETDTRTRSTVSGGAIPEGDAYIGRSASAGRDRGERENAVRVGEDLYAGKNGTVYRRDERGWQENSGSGWHSIDTASPAASQREEAQARNNNVSPSQSLNQETIQSIERQSAARDQGDMRTRSYRSGSNR